MSIAALAAVAGKTARENLRQPVFLIVLAAGGILIAMSPSFALFSLFENEKLVQDMGMATILLVGLILAATSAASTVSEEIESRTALHVLSKPVSRGLFVVGKFLGIAASLLCAFYLLTLILGITLRVGVLDYGSKLNKVALAGELGALGLVLLIGGAANYFFDRPFTRTAVLVAVGAFTVAALVVGFLDENLEAQALSQGLDLRMLVGCSLLLPAVLVLAALALVLSTRLNVAANIATLFSLFILGLLSDYLFGRPASGGNLAARIAYGVIPNLQVFWMADAVTMGRDIPAVYVLWVWLYGIIYTVGLVLLAALLFRRREVS